MPPRGRKPQYFRYKTYTPRNRAQQIRIRIGQPPDRPIRVHPRDAVKWEEAIAPSPYWWVMHRRGPKRPRVGLDYQESRAVSRGLIRGSLYERIFYRKLNQRRLYEPADFTFQSSMDGGRMELGGMVVDFLFEYWRLAVRVHSYTHQAFMQAKRDEEQAGILNSFGFEVLDLWDKTILNELALEEWFRRHIDFRATANINPETYTEAV